MDEIDPSPPTGAREETAVPDPGQAGVGEVTTPAEAGTETSESPSEGQERTDGDIPDYRFPENFQVDQGNLSEFQAVADKHQLSPEAAQELLDLYVDKHGGEHRDAHELLIQNVQRWEAETKADELVGGPEFERKLGVARTALDRFGDQGLRDYLDSSGIGSNPHVVRWMYRIGQFAADDRYIQPGSGAGPLSPEARARRLYDNTYKD